MLTVHHLRRSQSERIVWLCEELGLPYELKSYDRDPVTMLATPEYKALSPMGTAPVINDGDAVLSESGAVLEFILARYGGGRLAIAPSHPEYVDYLNWLHFANGTLQPVMGRNMIVNRLDLPADNPMRLSVLARLDRVVRLYEDWLGKAQWLAGSTFTVADIMTIFSLTTMRLYYPLDLTPVSEHPGLSAANRRAPGVPARDGEG